MSEANPITFAESLRTVLARYIATTLPISRRYPRLGREFRELLNREQLVQGPYVEALPDFENAIVRASVNRLSSGYFVDPQWARQLSDYANSKRVVDQPQKMREIAAAARKIPPSFFQPVRPMSCSHFAFVAEVMVPAAEKAHAKGVKLDFYFPPIPLATYPVFETRDSLKTAGVDETIFSQLMSFHRCAIIALDRLSREGVKVHAVDTDQSITAHLRYYKDTVHLMDEDKNQRILQDIKGGKYLVTVASLNRYEALLSNQIIANYHRAAR
ncbi:MAG: hypothetical protein EOP21_01770 [Hyphomicrobiales bacterium]|nr:MAG: hypothetical protein EOP21_01770 [Hyphomicrobiales bacterium]